MKKLLVTMFSLFFVLLLLSGCSSKGADKMIGKWKSKEAVSGVSMIYEFSGSKLTMEMQGGDMKHPKIETTYTVKSDDGKTVIIEVVHPVSQMKGDFSIVLDGNNMKMTDPDGIAFDLVKM